MWKRQLSAYGNFRPRYHFLSLNSLLKLDSILNTILKLFRFWIGVFIVGTKFDVKWDFDFWLFMSYTSKCFGIFVFTFPSVQMHLYAVEYPVPPSPLVTHLFCVPHQKKSVFESLFDKGAGPMKIAKFLKTLFSQNTWGRLLLRSIKGLSD